ncbi:MAG TPA: hypothetical protein VNW99_05650, partial [Cytophagaceae bacterium]|nr:hypothetical protein [Cytophagaceae bacterium]
RIKNEFGGFYGDGSQLLFRQLRLEGVLNKFLKYEIGDIDIGLTPYTIYNFDEIYHDYEADVFAIRRSVVHYENFNYGNKWRVQGFNGVAMLKFNKGIEKIGLRGFATRNRSALFSSYPDRLMVGGRVDLMQSKNFTIGANYVNLFDIYQTTPNIITNYNNKIFTADFKAGIDNENLALFLSGEAGLSNYRYDTSGVVTRKDTANRFYDLGLSVKYKPLAITLSGNYRYVGDNYSSPAAQTRRIYDLGVHGQSSDYRSGMIYSNIGNNFASNRNPILFDRLTQENMRNVTIQTMLISYLPQYNNITPYGIATPNRKGITLNATVGEQDKVIKADVTVDLLNEVSGAGDPAKRKFTGIKGGMVFSLNKLLKYEKILNLSFGIRNEHTQRGGANPIDLTSNLMDAGLTAELVRNLDLLLGYKVLSAKGNEFIARRDVFNFIKGFDRYNLDVQEGVFALGGRYRFSKNTYFTAQGHFVSFINHKNAFENKNAVLSPNSTYKINGNGNYKINQLFLAYTMIF